MSSTCVQHGDPPSYLLPTKLWFYENKATNYVVWRAQCLDLFRRQNVLGYVNGTIVIPPAPVVKPDNNLLTVKDVELKQWILSVLDDGVADQTNIGKKTCRQIWLELETKFQDLFGQIPTWSTDSVGIKTSNDEYLSMYRAAIQGDKIAVKHMFDNDIGLLMIENPNFLSVQFEGSSTSTYHLKVNLLGATPNVEILAAQPRDDESNSGVFPKHTAPIFAQKTVLKYLKFHIMDDTYEQSCYALSVGFALLLSAIDAQYIGFALDLVKKYPRLARLKLSSKSALSSIAGMKAGLPPSLNFNSIWSIPIALYESWLLFPRRHLRMERVTMLIKHLCEEIRDGLNPVEAEEIYREAILLAAVLGSYKLVEEILKVFPAAVTCSDPASLRNILHMAVKSRSEDLFNLVCRKISDTNLFPPENSDENLLRLYVNMPDINGNNLLHLAAKLPDGTQMINLLSMVQNEVMWYQQIRKIVHPSAATKLNCDGESPEMIFAKEHKGLMDKTEKWMKDTASAGTVVAALICTISFTAIITLPGGNNGTTGYPIFSETRGLKGFPLVNAMSLALSSASLMLFLGLMSWGHQVADFVSTIPNVLSVAVWFLLFSVVFMLSSSISALFILFAHDGTYTISSIPICISLFVILSYYMPQLVILCQSSVDFYLLLISRRGKGFLRSPPFDYDDDDD